MIEIEVFGLPRPKGSKTVMRTPQGRANPIESGGKGLKLWRARLTAAIQERAPEGGPITGPVAVFCHFRLPMPKKPRWPFPIPRKRDDLDKHCRSTLDELAEVLIEDDSQVVHLDAIKTYGTPGARIVVIPEAEWHQASRITMEAGNLQSKESARLLLELQMMRADV